MNCDCSVLIAGDLVFLFLSGKSDYSEAVKEIGDLCANSSWPLSSSPLPLRYKQGRDDNFGGTFSGRERFSYFDHRNDSVEVPCGFFKEFPISVDGESWPAIAGVFFSFFLFLFFAPLFRYSVPY